MTRPFPVPPVAELLAQVALNDRPDRTGEVRVGDGLVWHCQHLGDRLHVELLCDRPGGRLLFVCAMTVVGETVCDARWLADADEYHRQP